jgi:ABC-type transport system substrate-binding protein
MSSKNLKEVTQGVTLALLIYVVSSSAVPMLLAPAYAQGAPLFSVTLIAPTGGNVARRQYSSIIAQSLISMSIDAKLFYVTFDQLSNRLFFADAPAGSLFNQGGYDIGFIGWGPTSPVPDFRSNVDGRPAYLAPNGNNYALYNSAEMNAVLDQLYSTIDVQKQHELTKQMQEIVFRDAPYNYIYSSADIVARSQKWTTFGGKDVYSTLSFPDVQHWAGGTELTFAEANPVFPGENLNPVITTASNSFYALYMYGAIGFGSSVGLQELDARTVGFYKGMADSITSSADGKDWTVKIKPGILFHSGVEVTADDFIFTVWAQTNPKSASVSLGGNIQYLGNVVDFTYRDGTKVTIDNKEKPTDPTKQGSWKAVDKYTLTWHMPDVYAFTGITYAALSPLPKHIMEKFAPETWDTQPFSTASAKTTYTWDTTKYGGSGSYAAVGPVGAGPYYLESYDFTRNLATLKKFKQYYNATGLQGMGQFTVETYKVVYIGSKDAAIAALKNGEVDVLDNNYQMAVDKATLLGIGANYLVKSGLGWQEQAFNMKHPVFGTGVDTPLGKSDPSKAAEAARHIRKGISHLIPRDQIVNQLLAGAGVSLATLVTPGYGPYFNSALKPDTYDINTAADEFRAAGYTININPAPAIAFSGTPFLGTGTVTINGAGRVADEMIIVQQSTDGKTWTNAAAAVSGNDTRYSVSAAAPPAFGTVWYRANFTGYVVNQTLASRPITPDLVNQYIQTKQYLERRLLPVSVTDPIAVSSTTNDALAILAVVVIVVLAIVLVSRTRKKSTPK